MSPLLTRLGRFAARHPWRTVGAWLVVLVALFGLQRMYGGSTQDDYTIPGLESTAGTAFLAEHFPERSGTDARVVIHGDHPPAQSLLRSVSARLARLPGVSAVDPPRLSADGDTALIGVHYSVPVTDFHGSEGVDALDSAVTPARDAGFQVELGGQVAENFSAPDGTAETIGMAAALIILVIALGSIVAAGLPLVVAIGGLGAGSAIIGLLSAATAISPTAPTIATMIGLGVGIDYALLLLGRHIEGLQRGLSPVEAAARATGTAGVSVVVAGLTVLVSLFGLRLASLPVYSSFGYATLAMVGAVVAAAVTLVPALCVLAGRRLLPRRSRALVTVRATGTRTQQWAGLVSRRPVAFTLASVVVLLALAAPTLAMRTWPQDAGSEPTSSTVRRAYDLVAAEYGPGANAPIVLAVDLSRASAADVVASVDADPGVASVVGPIPNAAGDAAVIVVEPTTAPAAEETSALLDRIRANAPDGVLVTGMVAVFADISDLLAERIWTVIGFVVFVSILLLTVLLRAPVVALKAGVMNLLSVAAAYGVITVVFQTDTGAHLVGLPHAAPVSSWVPILMFAALFGLSMDYEVFLMGRVREFWRADADAVGSVRRGLGATGRVITSAAAIMVAVFVGFAVDPGVTVKTLGIGMAVAVFIDATLVRMVLVPAVMALLGRAAWYLPEWMAARFPELLSHDEPEPVAAPDRDPVDRDRVAVA